MIRPCKTVSWRRTVYVRPNDLWLYTAADGSFAICTVVVVDRSGWTTFAAPARNPTSSSADTEDGEVTTADTTRMSL